MNPFSKAKLVLQVVGLLSGAQDLAQKEAQSKSPEERKQLMKAFLKKSAPLLISIGATFAAALIPSLKDAVRNHPIWAAALNSAVYFGHQISPSIFK